jgi:hypothetical protein
MDKSVPNICPGKEDQFNKKHGPSALGIFFAITVPIAIASGVGYWVWSNWATKFGQIRLGEQCKYFHALCFHHVLTGTASFDGEAPYIKYPVLVIAALVAVVQAIPLLAASLWRSASSMLGRNNRRFTTRDSFARGRGDEGELLGDDSDEEV